MWQLVPSAGRSGILLDLRWVDGVWIKLLTLPLSFGWVGQSLRCWEYWFLWSLIGFTQRSPNPHPPTSNSYCPKNPVISNGSKIRAEIIKINVPGSILRTVCLGDLGGSVISAIAQRNNPTLANTSHILKNCLQVMRCFVCKSIGVRL